jgi:hypothetical protein
LDDPGRQRGAYGSKVGFYGEIGHEASDGPESGNGCDDDENVNGFLKESGHPVAGEIESATVTVNDGCGNAMESAHFVNENGIWRKCAGQSWCLPHLQVYRSCHQPLPRDSNELKNWSENCLLRHCPL